MIEDYQGIAAILNAGGGYGFLVVIFIMLSSMMGAGYKIYRDYKKDKDERDEVYRTRHEAQIQVSTKLINSVERLADKLERNDILTALNSEHIISLAEQIDEKHGTKNATTFARSYVSSKKFKGAENGKLNRLEQ